MISKQLQKNIHRLFCNSRSYYDDVIIQDNPRDINYKYYFIVDATIKERVLCPIIYRDRLLDFITVNGAINADKVVFPIQVNRIDREERKTIDEILRTFIHGSGITKCKFKDIVFYVGEGIVFDENLTPLLMICNIINLNDGFKKPILYAHHSLILDKKDLLSKFIYNHIIPFIASTETNDIMFCNTANMITKTEKLDDPVITLGKNVNMLINSI